MLPAAGVALLRIAHVSDLHVLTPRGIGWREALFNKRLPEPDVV